MFMQGKGRISFTAFAALCTLTFTASCASVDVPDARNVNIPAPTAADARKTAINERPDSVMYLPLGEDVLVPDAVDDDSFPHEMVGPFELRGETLAGALQLILADYDISLAFETEKGLSKKITVANLRGDLGKVVQQVCALADLYCSYENGTVTVKEYQTFTVTLPPIGSRDQDTGTEYLDDIIEGLQAILGQEVEAPIADPTTRTIVYRSTQRTADIANRYFQRLRANTAMIVFETYIWEVSLNSGNSLGIDWNKLDKFGKFNSSININGSVGADFTNPISIGLPTTQDINGTPDDIVEFLSQFGAVKSISQPQITVLSGSEAELRVADTQNYVSQIATTLDQGQSTTSVNTDSVDTGFTLTIGSSWDKSTVYANVEIELTNVNSIDNFAFTDTGDSGGSTTIQLPQTSERQLTTQIRVRPGDSVLIAGLKRENDNFDTEGLGFMKPIVPKSRTSTAQNLELVIMLRPRVVVYTAPNDKRYVDYANKKHKAPGTGVAKTSQALSSGEDSRSRYPYPSSWTAPVPVADPTPIAPVPASEVKIPVMPAPAPVPTAAQPLAPAALPVAAPAAILTPEPAARMPAPPVSVSAPVSSGAPAPSYVSRALSVNDAPTRGVVMPRPASLAPASSSDGVAVAPAPADLSAQAPVSSWDGAGAANAVTATPLPVPATAPVQQGGGAAGPSPYESYDYYKPAY